MISRLNVKADVAELSLQLRALGNTAPVVIAAALNDTATAARKVGQAEVVARRNVSATGARRAIQLKKAFAQHLAAELQMRSGPIPLRYFAARMGSEGVTVNITGSRKGPVTKFGNRAFIVRSPRSAETGRRSRKLSRHPELVGEVMVREGSHRLRIRKLFGPSVGSVLKLPEVIELLKSTAAPLFIERLREKIRVAASGEGFRVS